MQQGVVEVGSSIMNYSIKSSEFTKMVKEEIKLIRHTYAIPVYNLDHVNKMPDKDLILTIEDDLFLDTMLCQLRGVIITFSKKVAKENRALEKNLEKKIVKLEVDIDSNEKDYRQKLQKLEDLNVELENLREKRMKGHQIRAKAEFTAGWEKSSNFFLNLEKKTSCQQNDC